MRIGKHCRRQGGFTYLTLLFAVAITGVVLAKEGIVWSQASQREKEKELLFVGNQYSRAIALYYQRTPGETKHYPAKLEDLLTDTRYAFPQHYLRKLYRDPITNQEQWGIIAAPEGGIMGIYSLSGAQPLKSTNFSFADRSFEGARKYSNWKFTYTTQMPVTKKVSQ